MANKNLHKAKKEKNDEFYTQYNDIQNEMNAYVEYNPDVFRNKVILCPCDDPEWSNFTKFFVKNFELYGIKKLISTSYATDSKNNERKDLIPHQLSFDEYLREGYDEEFSKAHGKIFVLDRDKCTFPVNVENLEWDYLKGDGDFRSDEVKKLRDEADVIITNPPFSLFREFLEWIIEADKSFVIVGNQNAITYKETFPLIRDNKIWLGNGFKGGATHFINKYYKDYAAASDHKEGMIRVSGVVWFTNIEHGKRHKKLELMTMADNIRYCKKKKFIDEGQYQKYDNYDALNCPLTDVIPSDYDAVMGVPISFLDKYNPEQFDIIGWSRHNDLGMDGGCWIGGKDDATIGGKEVYRRILIKHKVK